MDVDGKGALVTGGAMGLGKAFVNILLQNGAKVLFTDINNDVGQATLKEFQQQHGENNVRFIVADVTSTAQMKESFEMAKAWLGALHVVINNAGIGNESGDMWDKVVDINLKGPIRCSNLALEYLRKDKGGEGGVIINIASAGGLKPLPTGPVYCATKCALIMYTRSLAANPDNLANSVRVNCLCPAFADTVLLASIKDGVTTNTEAALKMVQAAGVMSVETVADAMFELLRDESKNGAAMAVSKNQGRIYVPFQ